jgi:hypothetical protein
MNKTEEAYVNAPVDFQSSQERDAYIIDNAEFFTVAFRIGTDKKAVPYKDLETAISAAGAAANFLKRNVLIYGVLGPLQAYVGAVHYNKDNLEFVPGRDGKVKDEIPKKTSG